MRVVENKNSFENNALIGSLITTLKNKKKFNIPSSEILENGEYPVISQDKKFISGYSDDDNFVLDASESSSYLVFGDHTCVIKNIKFPFIIGADGTQVFSSNEEIVLNDFLYYYILSGRAVSQNGYKRHFTELKEKSISYPCLEEQKTIVDFLNKKNIQIEKIETLISKMEQRNQYYLHGLTSGELAIKDGSTFENDESINKVVLNGKTKRVPASFDEFRLGDIIQEENKSKLAVKDAIEGEYPFFNCSETLSMTHNDYLVDGNYIIMSTGGKPSIHYYEGKIAYSSDSYVISATDNVNSRYLAFLLTANMKRIERCFLGSGLKHLNKKIFKKEVYHLPDLDKQKEVADFLSKNEDEVNLVRELYSKEKQVFQWLCEKLVSGEYRIEN